MDKLTEKIKLPSNWMLVNPESIWKYLSCIAKTGNVFTKDQLIKSGLYTTNEDNISRNLSYLKYLGLVDEQRGKGKDQRFNVVENSTVKNIIYELKANREQDAKQKLREHLEKHDLFLTLKSDFFKNENSKTLNELEHFLRDGIDGKSPQYYQKGGEFLFKLLSLASLARINGNDIMLENLSSSSSHKAEELTIPEVVETNDPKNGLPTYATPSFQEIELVASEKYIVHFMGPGMDSKHEIQDEDDILIVNATLAKIKKKLKPNDTN